MKVLSKKKLLKQYGFPRMYLLVLSLGAPSLGGGRDLGPELVLAKNGVERETA